MKQINMILLVILLITGCKKDENTDRKTCELTNPIEELGWLKDIKNSLTGCTFETSILQGTYNDQTVFYVAMTDPVINSVQTIVLFSCEGKVVEVIQPDKYHSFMSKVTNIKNLYQCKI